MSRIDQDFQKLITPLYNEGFSQLEQNIVLNEKCYNAIVGCNGLIGDGYNRFFCCMNRNEFEIEEKSFSDKNDVKRIDNQMDKWLPEINKSIESRLAHYLGKGFRILKLQLQDKGIWSIAMA